MKNLFNAAEKSGLFTIVILHFFILASMSLSRHLQTSLIPDIKGKTPSELKESVLSCGRNWFVDHPEEAHHIQLNLDELGIAYTPELLNNIKDNILLHYYEKLLPLTNGPEFYHKFLTTHIDGSEVVSQLKSISQSGRGILLATAHFGAVEFITPFLATNYFPMNVLLRFTTEQLSRSAHEMSEMYAKSGLFGSIRFIEIGKPKTSAAMEMAAVLRRNEMLLSVFDEKTDYSTPVTLFNKTIWGGAGLHKLIAFTQRDIAFFSIFLVRKNDGTYKLVAHEIDKSNKNAIQMLYDNLSLLLKNHLEQWYFLHEEIPFVESENN